MRYSMLGAALLALGCSTVRTVAPTVPDVLSRRVEDQQLPPDPAVEPLSGSLAKGDWVEPLEAGSCLGADGKPVVEASKPCPIRSGIAVSEERAARDGLYRIRYKELRRNYEADRVVWGAQRALYESRLDLANKALEQAQPSWFDQHKGELGLLGGLLLGAGAAVGIVYVTVPAFSNK
jgi:hypothetical protein